MRCLIMVMMGGLTIGLANETQAQVAAMGGAASPSVAAGNVNLGAAVANVGGAGNPSVAPGNANLGAGVANVGGTANPSVASGNVNLGVGMANMGGTANPSVAPGNMNLGAGVANVGGNANSTSMQSGVGAPYASISAPAVVGSNLTGAGYPLSAGNVRYSRPNSSTTAGAYGMGAAIGNQPGQPLALDRYSSRFARGGVTGGYNSGVRSRFGVPNNAERYPGQSVGQGGYNLPNVEVALSTMVNGGPETRFSNINVPGVAPINAPLNNGLPVYSSGLILPGVQPGYAPYLPYSNSAAFSYPTTNGLGLGSY